MEERAKAGGKEGEYCLEGGLARRGASFMALLGHISLEEMEMNINHYLLSSKGTVLEEIQSECIDNSHRHSGDTLWSSP